MTDDPQTSTVPLPADLLRKSPDAARRPAGGATGMTTAALARIVTNTEVPQIVAADAWLRLKDARGQTVTTDRLHRMIDQRNRLGPLWLSPDWLVAQAAAPSDRRTLADHAATARRNGLARIMGRIVKGGGA